MVSFNDVKAEFVKHGCILLMSEEEFNIKKSRTTKEKYKYTAQCNHNNEICFHNFKHLSQGINCLTCVNLEKSINQKEKYRLNPLLSHEMEFDSIEYLITLIGDSFDVKFNGEDCLADCCIKPKYITEDKWIKVQMKSTEKPLINGGGYKFNCCRRHSNYENCIIMCICASDKKMWIFDGNIITIKCISIGIIKSKKDDFEITTNIIHETITHYYNTFPKYDFETIDTPITQGCQLEREYCIYRETMITCLNFIRNERQALVYDFIVNGLKVQEKVRTQNKNRNSTSFTLVKRNGIINGV